MMTSMALSKKLLSHDERIILHLHEHIKCLIPNLVGAVVVLALAVVAAIFMPENWRPYSVIAAVLVGAALLIIVIVWPWMNWLCTTYTITNRRIITRRGIFAKTGHDIPLSRISDVAYEHDLVDRIFGCGTLVLQTSASDPLYLRDVPKVESVHVMLTEMLFSGPQDGQGAEAGADGSLLGEGN